MHTSLQARIGTGDPLVMNILYDLNGTYMQGTMETTRSASGARAMPIPRQNDRARTRTPNQQREAQEAPDGQKSRPQQKRTRKNRKGRPGNQVRPSAQVRETPPARTRIPASTRPVITPRALENLRHRVRQMSVQEWLKDLPITPLYAHIPIKTGIDVVPGLGKADIDDWVISEDEWDNL